MLVDEDRFTLASSPAGLTLSIRLISHYMLIVIQHYTFKRLRFNGIPNKNIFIDCKIKWIKINAIMVPSVFLFAYTTILPAFVTLVQICRAANVQWFVNRAQKCREILKSNAGHLLHQCSSYSIVARSTATVQWHSGDTAGTRQR